jgi:hypothetical protein
MARLFTGLQGNYTAIGCCSWREGENNLTDLSTYVRVKLVRYRRTNVEKVAIYIAWFAAEVW